MGILEEKKLNIDNIVLLDYQLSMMPMLLGDFLISVRFQFNYIN